MPRGAGLRNNARADPHGNRHPAVAPMGPITAWAKTAGAPLHAAEGKGRRGAGMGQPAWRPRRALLPVRRKQPKMSWILTRNWPGSTRLYLMHTLNGLCAGRGVKQQRLMKSTLQQRGHLLYGPSDVGAIPYNAPSSGSLGSCRVPWRPRTWPHTVQVCQNFGYGTTKSHTLAENVLEVATGKIRLDSAENADKTQDLRMRWVHRGCSIITFGVFCPGGACMDNGVMIHRFIRPPKWPAGPPETLAYVACEPRIKAAMTLGGWCETGSPPIGMVGQGKCACRR